MDCKECAKKEADRQYHMNAINRLEKRLGLGAEKSDKVVEVAIRAIREMRWVLEGLAGALESGGKIDKRSQPVGTRTTYYKAIKSALAMLPGLPHE
jgi:hypothetical protein